MQFKFKFARLFTLMMVFFLSTAQNIMAQKSLEPADAIQIAPRGAISLQELVNKGTVTIDAQTKQVNIVVDGKKLDPQVVASLKTQKSFTVNAPFELNKSASDAAYKSAKTSAKPIIVQKGTYDVQQGSGSGTSALSKVSGSIKIYIFVGWGFAVVTINF